MSSTRIAILSLVWQNKEEQHDGVDNATLEVLGNTGDTGRRYQQPGCGLLGHYLLEEGGEIKYPSLAP